MQISLETVLLILIPVYIVVATVLALIRRFKYLKNAPDEKRGGEYYRHSERIHLTFAGFSLTALALLIGLQINEVVQLSSTIQFFSLAFSLLIMSFVFLQFRFKNFFVFFSDVFFNAGLLSIGCGFLVFFAKNLSWYDNSTLIFLVLVIALSIALLANYKLFDKYMKIVGEVTK